MIDTVVTVIAGAAAAVADTTGAGRVPGDGATTVQLLGAGGVGAMLGWYVYYINRHRTGDVQMSDLVTLVGVLGGGAITALFPARTDLFGAYGIGLFIGFFGYFLALLVMVAISKNFNVDWFLDGRRKKPGSDMVGGDTPGGGNVMMHQIPGREPPAPGH